MAWRIFVRDAKRVLRNPVALIVTIAIAFLPGLYAWANIAANWDPYSSSGNLHVAVANEDAGSYSSLTGKVNIGKQLMEQLKSSHSLGWQFVSSDVAREGVASGRYYAALIVPRDFSSHLVGALEGSGRRPQLQYYVNEKLNPIAPKVTDIGASTVEGKISTEFTRQVSKAVVAQLRKARTDIDNGLASTRDDAVSSTEDALKNIESTRKSIDGLVASLKGSKTSLKAVDKKLSGLGSSVEDMRRSLKNTQKLISSTRKSADKFNSSASLLLSNGASNLSLLSMQAGNAASTIDQALTDVSVSANDVQAKLSLIVSLNDSIVSQLGNALENSGIPRGSDTYKAMEAQISTLRDRANAQRAELQSFTSASRSALSSAQTAANNMGSALSNGASSGANLLNTANSQLNGNLSATFSATLGSLETLVSSADGTLIALSSNISQTRHILSQLDGLIGQTSATLSTTSGSLGKAAHQLDKIRTDLVALDSSRIWRELRNISLDPQEISTFISSPVSLETKAVYPISNYGSAIAPFYTNLALWVGGFILVAIIKIEVDREGLKKFRARDAYMGRFLIFLGIGLFQGLITTVGDLLMGIQCKDPVLFILAGVFLSFTYVSIMYALATTFKHIGKAIGVLLVIVQIPGSSGTYPIELMPKFFRNIEPWLPFTYGINAMRETIGGLYKAAYWHNIAMLLPFIIGAFLVGIYVRPYMLNLNALFDRRLGETDLFIAEKNNLTNSRFRLSNILQNLLDSAGYKERIRKRSQAFLRVYPRLIAGGIASIIIIPIIFLVLMFVVPVKIGFLIAWIVSIIVIDMFLIILEYMRESYTRELGLSEMTGERMRTSVLDHIRRRWFFADDSPDAQDGADNTERDTGGGTGSNGSGAAGPAAEGGAGKGKGGRS